MKSFRAYLREDRLDELSKTTLGSYIKKSTTQIARHAAAGAKVPTHDKEAKNYYKGRVKKRLTGVRKAVNKLKRADKPKKVRPVKMRKVAKKNNFSHMGVHSMIARGISAGISKGIVGVARKVLK